MWVKAYPLTTMKSSSTAICSTKSTRATPTADSGRISRGKYTFFTRFEFPRTDSDACVIEAENRFQGSRPASRYTG